MWEILAVSLVSALDGLVLGVGVGVARQKFRLRAFLCFFGVSFVTVAVAAGAAAWARGQIDPQIVRTLGGGLLAAAGLMNFKSCVQSGANTSAANTLTRTALWTTSFSLALDGSVAAVSLGLLGAAWFTTAMAFGGMQTLLIWLGNRVGFRAAAGKSGGKIQVLPSLVLVGMGVMKMIR